MANGLDLTNGGPDSIAVVTVGFGGNGALTTVLEPIRPEGPYGDRMTAQFVDGKLWVKNAVTCQVKRIAATLISGCGNSVFTIGICWLRKSHQCRRMRIRRR